MENRYIISFFVAVLTPFMASAQNLNPTVSVTREYQGKILDVHKPLEKMPVSDTLTRFDLDFDYSVFENPYKGAYDFKPYSMEMRPEQEQNTARKIYLRAGAGWNLRPSVDFVYEPLMKKHFHMSLYASHHSYIGNYKYIGIRDGKLRNAGGGDSWSGYDMYSNAGLNGQADFNTARLAFDVNYLGIHTKETAGAVGYNAANASFRVKSENPSDTYLYYDIAMKYRYGVQGMRSPLYKDLSMNDYDFTMTIGPVLGRYNRVVAEIGMGMTWYDGLSRAYTGNYYVTPKYMLEKKRWNLSLGVRISDKLNSEDEFLGYRLNTNKGIYVYPDIHIKFAAIRDYMDLYFTAKGGENRNSYASLKERNHFFAPVFPGQMTNNTVERYNLSFGFDGNIRNRLGYDIKAGYASYESALLDCIFTDVIDGRTDILCSGVAWSDYRSFYTAAALQWESRDVSVRSSFKFNSSDIDGNSTHTSGNLTCFEPASFTGDISVTYNWKRRIFFGMSADISSARNSVIGIQGVRIPAWTDLGIHAEYAFSHKMSFWLRGQNLLGMNCQRYPIYTSGGIGLTGGVCVNL